MLSRIAESLYWLARYVERAENTARLLDVNYHLLLEDPHADEARICRTLLDAMGVDPAVVGSAQPDANRVSTLLAQDLTLSGSISYSFGAAWENARGAREAISSELWEAVNATHRELQRRTQSATGLARHDFFGWVRDRAAVCHGIVDSTMSRDDGWRFFTLGRSLERADMTMRVLLTPYGDTFGRVGWTTTLRSCSAYEAYVRTYHRPVEAAAVVEFLLLDRLFPRSVYHSLLTAEQCLRELDPTAGRARVDDEARRIMGRLRSQLEFIRVDDALVDLPQLLRRLEREGTTVHAAIARRYFQATRVMEWTA
jgi:uncharacterized alpha-E superfamily protein